MSDSPVSAIQRAFVLAAGLGKRMRPITATVPKPLVEVAGRALLDHALDRAAEAGIGEAVVNVHYLADLLEGHLARRSTAPAIRISDERDALLETGGGVKKALPLLGTDPFVVLNSDSFWLEGPQPNLGRLIDTWEPERMDILLLVAPTATSLGYEGKGDFVMNAGGALQRRGEREVAPFIYAGVAILKPELFAGTPEGAFSLNLLFDRAIERERLFGLRLDGQWLHVGTPEAIEAAEARVKASAQVQ
ncbi:MULTISPECIES: nucleotidyltransferase family protein [Methylobacterium]|uniref:D-glycero-alpha-D-manno-heptose 1-phosphate guanylyltransferase n=1 Tax=Methylobacterium bullatum TaxID=570505 RepID=A0A679JTF0_9HYPH|nr:MULTISPECIES: nucleotidyltransferase family protein [Methylobacterium]KQO53131.1 mannose-1-phosphate guanylyltransferase [Methylobacterium sp. Leaf85]KQP11778.1 mannose-1-phosphate guanylyltransferase [Methylobacterium sp. Leaf93]MBD8903767.1 nucleotidyltransferase family protein [Methylobacterium bullatum]CAA2143722.1 D-glycero-alpha-D-manno-heptose 1-phosphate guanylyltransferase [Methylobacterium bullatum]GJD42135.1 N-acetylmuramate alpha-1-phosphate uridylyltransferase [Methylobacterium